jgi:hypothetical protein
MSVRAQFIPLPPGEGQRVRESTAHQRGAFLQGGGAMTDLVLEESDSSGRHE